MALFITLTLLQVSDTDEESDEEFEYNSSIDNSSRSDDESSDEKEDAMCYLAIDNFSHGTYVLYQWGKKNYYVGNVTDITSSEKESQIMLNLMKKYVWRKNLYFTWPLRAHKVVADDLQVSTCLWLFPHPMTDRSGTTVIYDVKQFDKIPLTHIF